MASSLLSLKAIPCKNGDKCELGKLCLFRHAWDDIVANDENKNGKDGELVEDKSEKGQTQVKTGEEAKQPQPTTTPSTSLKRPTSMNLESPHKKRLKSVPNELSKSLTPMASALESAVKPSTTTPEKLVQATTQSETLPASKPALSKNTAEATAPSKIAPSKSLTEPKKPETLNPRLLSRAPAQHEFRSKLLKALHEQYQRLNSELKKSTDKGDGKLVLSAQALIVKALDDEQDIAVKKSAVYSNTVKNRIMQYKRMSVAKWKEERVAAVKEAKGEKDGVATTSKVIDTGLTTKQEIDFVPRLSVTLDGYAPYGYVTSVPKDADIDSAKKAVEASGNTEICDRCKRRFAVFPGRREEDGALASNGTCLHHPGKIYFVDRRPGDRGEVQKRYRCCHQSIGDTEGCTTGETHVFKTVDPNRLGGVLNFVKTPPNPDVPVDRAACFDCEMAYTVYGMELIRLTVISWPAGDTLLDVLVQPIGEILDLNTRYSGISTKDMVEAERWKPGDDPSPKVIASTGSSKPPERKLKIVPSPEDARDLLFSIISPNTPLIGHGTENDLNAVRIIHPTVIDTVLLYPHKRGLPIRNSLKYLMDKFLDRKIQVDKTDENDIPQGHDSAEDAMAAGDLVRLRIKEEWHKMQLKGWKIVNEEVMPPE